MEQELKEVRMWARVMNRISEEAWMEVEQWVSQKEEREVERKEEGKVEIEKEPL